MTTKKNLILWNQKAIMTCLRNLNNQEDVDLFLEQQIELTTETLKPKEISEEPCCEMPEEKSE